MHVLNALFSPDCDSEPCGRFNHEIKKTELFIRCYNLPSSYACKHSVLILSYCCTNSFFFPVQCPRGLLAQCHYNNSRLIIIITIITTLGNSHYIRGCLCDMQLLTLAAELFTMDQCLVLLRAFCSMDDNSKVEFQTCLTQMAEKVYYITHYATGCLLYTSPSPRD